MERIRDRGLNFPGGSKRSKRSKRSSRSNPHLCPPPRRGGGLKRGLEQFERLELLIQLVPRIFFAAAIIDSIIFLYPVQRQMLPCIKCLSSSSVGLGFSPNTAFAPRTIPGVQKPHWNPPYSMKASCKGCNFPSVASPSMVRTDL